MLNVGRKGLRPLALKSLLQAFKTAVTSLRPYITSLQILFSTMPPKPECYQSVSNTLATENLSESSSGNQVVSGWLCFLDLLDHTHILSLVPDGGDANSNLLSPTIHGPLGLLCFLNARQTTKICTIVD